MNYLEEFIAAFVKVFWNIVFYFLVIQYCSYERKFFVQSLSWSYVYFLHLQHSIMSTTFFELQLWFLFIMNVVLGFEKYKIFLQWLY